ncbi:MAG TPA: Clp protease N-terminal domain-containing protein [Planctomycetota bacterium]|jgi:ATP-dependent Clp protease ATP-binding subunit ClpA|nr:Clp protease N-terminal domain-containing protein [Planctomycetota bacterium]
MSLDPDDPELAPLLARLAPYTRSLVGRAGTQAMRLHADTVTPEHLLSVLVDDPESAAHAAILHAFADPATISSEALAISPGLMVVASGSTLPFSPGAVDVLARAHRRSRESAADEVEVGSLLIEAAASVEPGARDALRAAGLAAAGEARAPGPDSRPSAGFFKRFTTPAKRALSAANRFAAGERAAAISPAHLLLGCLAEEPANAAAGGLSVHRARAILSGRTVDDRDPEPRRLQADPSLLRFLRGVEPGSSSLGLLARFLSNETPELAGILTRSKVTAAFLERAREAFQDPETVKEPPTPRR